MTVKAAVAGHGAVMALRASGFLNGVKSADKRCGIVAVEGFHKICLLIHGMTALAALVVQQTEMGTVVKVGNGVPVRAGSLGQPVYP